MKFDYYYGSESEQYTFLRIPKIMIKDPIFSKVSLSAKLLYGVLLDRMSLSIKNKWFDKDNRAYIIYQISEIEEDLGLSKKMAIKFLKELEDFGLIEKKKRGFGLPSLLYVKNFISKEEFFDSDNAEVKEETMENINENQEKNEQKLPNNNRSVEMGTSRGVEMGTSRSVETVTSRSVEMYNVPIRVDTSNS